MLLKNELKDMTEIRDRCSALATEVSSLRQALESLKETAKLQLSKPPEQQPRRRTYARAVRPPSSKPAANKSSDGSKPVSNKSSTRDNTEKRHGSETRQERVTVTGVRRVWGTFKSTSEETYHPWRSIESEKEVQGRC